MIVWFDLETTGKSVVKDKIVQISAIKTNKQFQIIEQPKKILINPLIPIPQDATEVHGITDEMVKDSFPFERYASNIFKYFSDCILGGFNIRQYDVPLLAEELGRCGYDFPRADVQIIDCKHIYHKREPRNLAAAVKFYCGYELLNAHDAEEDNKATINVGLGQSIFYGITTEQMIEECKQDDNVVDFAGKVIMQGDVAVYTFGKHKGKPVKDFPDFARWMQTADFSTNTKNIVKAISGIK